MKSSGPIILAMVVGLGLMFAPPVVSGAGTQSLLIPLYVYPGCSWDSVIGLKAQYSVNIVIIANPANGPGYQKDSVYAEYIQKMRDAGISVLGYVWTNYGKRDSSIVEDEIDSWVSWYNVSGIFFDGVNVSAGTEGYYSSLVNYVKGKSQSYLVVGNPGAYDPSTLADYTAIFDVLVIYDSPDYPPSWPSGTDPSKLGAMVYGVSSFDETAFKDLASKAYYVYVTDDGDDNPWDSLSSYVADEAAVLAGVPKVNYVLRVSSHNTTGYSVIERYPSYDVSGGTYNVSWDVLLRNWDSSGAGVQLMYLVLDQGGSTVEVHFDWAYYGNGTALYACYGWTSCTDTDFNVTSSWHRLAIAVDSASVKFYVDGLEVRNVATGGAVEVLRVGAGSWDKTSQYDLYIDNVTEKAGVGSVVETFDCGSNCYFSTLVGDVGIVPASTVAVPFFGSSTTVVVLAVTAALLMRRW
ncbi:hypothetical protein CL1_0801 [Thermococcus cleftensis]|uniref:Uncharacterized protein n=1 Tax=Thermococcus cleftensis (strain DSM 27260 / KACC 17922 / CL1) TaxID=163003 RepID=I3ZTH2_THECF|nr:spherulation-specific family 4 protein [Thermococcus cleftensis]AFL95006.1 hypothetical protein CL1_0801 [Thermococcus cleftensis]